MRKYYKVSLAVGIFLIPVSCFFWNKGYMTPIILGAAFVVLMVALLVGTLRKDM